MLRKANGEPFPMRSKGMKATGEPLRLILWTTPIFGINTTPQLNSIQLRASV